MREKHCSRRWAWGVRDGNGCDIWMDVWQRKQVGYVDICVRREREREENKINNGDEEKQQEGEGVHTHTYGEKEMED